MSDDRIRAMFRRADAAMSDDAPTLEATMRQAKRERTTRRLAGIAGAAVVVAIVGVIGAVLLRPQVEELTPTGPSPDVVASPTLVLPCASSADMPTAADVVEFVNAFMERRVTTSDAAEPCLSEMAVQAYRDNSGPPVGEGSMCLYACGDFDIKEYRLDTPPQQADANSWSVDVVVVLSDGTETVRVTETLFVGPGTSSDGEQQPLIVRGATTGG